MLLSLAWALAVVAAVVVAIAVAVRRGLVRSWAAHAIEKRLGGYRQPAHEVDPAQPRRLEAEAPKVAVVGGGLAGIGAAATLAERGIAATLFEHNSYLGGKIGAWRQAVGDGEQTIDHGFHAFFRQYYNLNRFLDRLGIRDRFTAIEDYLIIDASGRAWSFGDVERIPVLNIVDLGKRGFFRWRDVARKRTRDRLDSFVRFDMERIYEQFDGLTFQELCDDAALPNELRVSFRTFARAFFSDEVDLSAADVLRAFHFYYLSHDHGLMYDYPAGDYESVVLAPIAEHLAQHGVDLRLGAGVQSIARGTSRRFRIDGEEFDWVVLAASIPGMQDVVRGSPWMREAAPELVEDLLGLRTSHGYSVWRLWTDRDLREGMPTFINVERRAMLDSVTLYHRITDEARDWAERHRGAVLELHSYAISPGIDDVRAAFLKDLEYYFPELIGMTVHHEVLQIRNDFPAFAPGQRALRPSPTLPIEGLLMAGDWVNLPYPMTHMEAAFTSGLECANAIFDTLGLQGEPIFSVAPRGLLRPRKAA